MSSSAAKPSIPVTHGTANATTIVSDTNSAALAATRYVTLSASYARVIPPAYPEPNAGAPSSLTRTAQTIANGARVLFFAGEAAALVAAGAGSYS